MVCNARDGTDITKPMNSAPLDLHRHTHTHRHTIRQTDNNTETDISVL